MFITKLTEKKLVDPIEFEKKKRPPKHWSEEELALLGELYEEHKGSDDVVGSIIEKLEIKRSKKAVIEKLLDVGLINDRTEVKKKGRRSKKKYQTSSQITGDSDSESERRRETGPVSREFISDSGSSSDSDSDNSSDDERNDRTGNAGSYDHDKCFNLGKGLMIKDMGVALRWLRQSLKYYLEDIIDDPDSDESVPLVPIDSDCILAVGDTDFRSFLKNLGIQPPGQGVSKFVINVQWLHKKMYMNTFTYDISLFFLGNLLENSINIQEVGC